MSQATTASAEIARTEIAEDGARLLTKSWLSGGRTPDDIAREARFLKVLSSHPGFPRLVSSGEGWFKREFVPGEDLSHRAGRFGTETLLDIAVQMARLLSFSHQNEIALGDVKPANAVFTPESRVVFVDLSLAGRCGEPALGGSPAYMAPELFYGGMATPASDLYALGAFLFELTCGKTPFAVSGDWDGLARAHWFEEPVLPESGDLPEAWGYLILRLLAKKPAERFFEANDVIRFINANWRRDFALEPIAVTARKHLADFSSAETEKLQTQKTIATLLAKTPRSRVESEILARLLIRTGRCEALDRVLAELPPAAAAHFAAQNALRRGRPGEARELAENAIAAGELKALNVLGTCAFQGGRYLEAKSHYSRLYAHYRRERNFGQAAPVLVNLAHAFVALGEIKSAEESYAQALALARLTGDSRQEALAWAAQGYFHHCGDAWGRAYEAYSRAVAIYRWLGMEKPACLNRLNMAAIALACGVAEEAIAAAEDVLRGAGHDAELLARAWLLKADAFRVRGEAGAEAACERALASALQIDNAALRSEARLLLARLALESGQPAPPRDIGEEERKKWDALSALIRFEPGRSSDKEARALESLSSGRLLAVDDRLRLLSALCAHYRLAGDLVKAAAVRRERAVLFARFAAEFPETLAGAAETRFGAAQDEDGESSRTLMEIATGLITELDAEALAAKILDKLIGFTKAERGFILVKDGGDARIALSRHFDGQGLESAEQRISWSLARQVLENGRPLVTLDAAHDARFPLTESIHHLKLKTVVCLPFVHKGEVLGAVYLDARRRLRNRGEDVIRALEPFAEHMAAAIANAQLFSDAKQDLRRTQAELVRIKDAVGADAMRHGLVCRSAAMLRAVTFAERAAATDAPVLVTGESGTGKERLARLLHDLSARRAGPFVAVNCAAIPETLIESELFGYKRGAFTGADRDKRGLIESARGGTLFLDEIGEMPLGMQAKLLRTLQEREYLPVGGDKAVKSDIRVIAATNRDLRTRIRENGFREDLFYRLQVAEIRIPPLRERKEDVPYLARYIMHAIAERENIPVKTFSEAALAKMARYDWPGNVRELENVVYKILVFATESVVENPPLNDVPQGEAAADGTEAGLVESKRMFEKRVIEKALERFCGNVSHAARHLKVARPHLSYLIKQHGIDRLRFKPS